MDSKKNVLLKVTLVIFAILTFGYGIIYLFFPEIEINATGAEPIPPGWIRWIGSIFIALGIGAVMIYRKPEKQKIFVTAIAIGLLLDGLALLYTVFFENEGIGNIWNTAVPAIVVLILSVLFWISLKQSKETLG